MAAFNGQLAKFLNFSHQLSCFSTNWLTPVLSALHRLCKDRSLWGTGPQRKVVALRPSPEAKKLGWGPGGTVGWKENAGPLCRPTDDSDSHFWSSDPLRGRTGAYSPLSSPVTRIQGH